MLFEYDLQRDKSKCLLCGKWMNDGNEQRHLLRVHGYDKIDALIAVSQYARHQLKLVNESMWDMIRVAPG